jgi:hypothetical protein
MSELSTVKSYIVRVYRIDPEDPTGITGVVETMDGSGAKTPFTSSDELAEILNRDVGKRHRRKRRNEG